MPGGWTSWCAYNNTVGAPARVQPLADHERLRALHFCRAHVLEAVGVEQLDGRLGAGADVGAPVGIGTDARDAHELLELGARPVERAIGRGGAACAALLPCGYDLASIARRRRDRLRCRRAR